LAAGTADTGATAGQTPSAVVVPNGSAATGGAASSSPVRQGTGGPVMSQSGSGATSALPTDKGSNSGNNSGGGNKQ
jgi:hypothetical protein